jgi:hypothetical protein
VFRVHYVRRPFQREPDFGVTSVNYDFAELLAKRSLANARRYHANRAAFDAAWAEELGWPPPDKAFQTCDNGERQC